MASRALVFNVERTSMLRRLTRLAWHEFTNCRSLHRHCASCGGRGANLSSNRQQWLTCAACEGSGSFCPKFGRG